MQKKNGIPGPASQKLPGQFPALTNAYEKTLLLKQGFYNYNYVTTSMNEDDKIINYETAEGHYWDTENVYTVLVYYRPFGARADELIGYTQINSLQGRPGLR